MISAAGNPWFSLDLEERLYRRGGLGNGRISEDGLGESLRMFLLRLISVIDDSAPLTLRVCRLVDYSLILPSVYRFSVSNCSHVAKLYIQRWRSLKKTERHEIIPLT